MKLARKYPHEILLGLILVFHIVSNYVWLGLDIAPLAPDPAGHTRVAVATARCLDDLFRQGIINCLSISPYHPPFAETIVAVVMKIVGVSIFVAQFTNSFLFALMILSVYLWSKEFYKNKTIALFTAAVTSLLPEIYNSSRSLWEELPLAAMCYITMYALLRSKHFSNNRYTLLSFLLLGLSLFTKQHALIYLVIPFLITTIKSQQANGLKFTLKKLIKGALVTTLAFGPWFFVNFKLFFYYTLFFTKSEPSEPISLFSIDNFLYYPRWLLNFGLGAVLTVLFIFGLIVIFKKAETFAKVYIPSIILFVYLFLTFAGNKDQRYFYFVLPILVSVVAFLLLSDQILPKLKILGVSFALTILAGLSFQYFEFSYNLPFKTNWKYAVKLPVFGWLDLVNIANNYPAQPYYSSFDWPDEEVIEDVYALSKGKPVTFQVIAEFPKLNTQYLTLISEVKGYNNLSINRDVPFKILDGFKTKEEALSYIDSKDYFLVPQNEWSVGWNTFKPLLDPIQRELLDGSNKFTFIKTYYLPYEEIEDVLKQSRRADDVGVRYKYCKNVRCDKLYLVRIGK